MERTLPTDLREPRQTQSPALSPITHVHLHYHRLHLLLLAQCFILNSNLALQQIVSSTDLALSYRTDYMDSRTI